MTKQKTGIEERLREELLNSSFDLKEKQEKIAKILLICGLVLGGLFLSKYLLNEFADTVRAVKKVRRAFME